MFAWQFLPGLRCLVVENCLKLVRGCFTPNRLVRLPQENNYNRRPRRKQKYLFMGRGVCVCGGGGGLLTTAL